MFSNIPESVFNGLISERIYWTVDSSHCGLGDGVFHPRIKVESVGPAGINLVQN